MKTCPKCNTAKDISEFRKNKAKADGLSTWCKKCASSWHSTYYSKNKSKWRSRNRAHRKYITEKINKLKESTPCKLCKLFWPACVMDFDHRDPSLKSFNISSNRGTNSWEVMEKEILKCDLLCANCHRMKTHIGSID